MEILTLFHLHNIKNGNLVPLWFAKKEDFFSVRPRLIPFLTPFNVYDMIKKKKTLSLFDTDDLKKKKNVLSWLEPNELKK